MVSRVLAERTAFGVMARSGPKSWSIRKYDWSHLEGEGVNPCPTQLWPVSPECHVLLFMANLSKLEVSSITGGAADRTSPEWLQGGLGLQGVPARRDLSVELGEEGWGRAGPCPVHWGGRDGPPDREEALRGWCGGRSPLRGRGEWGGCPPGLPPSWPGRGRPGAATAPWWTPERGTEEKAELSPMTR